MRYYGVFLALSLGLMLSVLIISPAPIVPGGVSVFAECLKKHLSATRYTSFYVGSTGKEKKSGWSVLKRLCFSPFKLIFHVMTHEVDLVHLNPTFDAKSLIRDLLLMLLLQTLGHKKVLFYIHGWDKNFFRKVNAHHWLRGTLAWAINKASMVTVLSDQFRDSLIEMGIEPTLLKVTHTMYDESGLATAQSLPPAAGRPFILFMSRFDREKGGRELLEAFISIAHDYPDLDLVMAGDGEDAKNLLSYALSSQFSERIHFTGYISGPQKWRYLKDCKIFALPTYYRSEGMPIVVLEAMGSGKPILIGPAGGLPSLLSQEKCGAIIDNITPQSVAGALRSLFSDPLYLEMAGQHNQKLAMRTFEAKIVSSEIEKFYQQVAVC